MKKHAYLIIAHKSPYILTRLLKMLDDERNDIFIHIDKKSNCLNKSELQKHVIKSKLYFTKSISVYWGHSSQVDCEMLLLKACVKQGNYDYVHLISGVDLPIKTQDYIHTYFEKNYNKQFLQISETKNHLIRLSKYHFFVERTERKGLVKLIYSINDYLNCHFSINRLKKYKNKFKIIKTSNWFSITG